MRGWLIACLCLGWAMPAAAGAIHVIDDTGRALRLEGPPQRIVSLTPHLTEILFAVGAGAQLVGVDSASDYPPAARKISRIGDFSRINFERILALQPDLVVAWVGGNRALDVHAVTQLGIPVLLTRATSLDDVARLLRLVGVATGHAISGERQARGVELRFAALRRATAPRSARVKVFYQVWDRPLMTLGGRHWISDALTVCGARNVFDDLHGLSAVISREAVVLRAPALIAGGSDVPELRRGWRRFDRMAAVRDDAFVQVDADLLHRPSPRLVEGVERLCRALDPFVRRSVRGGDATPRSSGSGSLP